MSKTYNDGDGHMSMPMYGVTFILNDNIATAVMPTTAGSVALGESIPSKDAFIVTKLKGAGAIILGKGTLTEFANFFALANPSGRSSQLPLPPVDVACRPPPRSSTGTRDTLLI